MLPKPPSPNLNLVNISEIVLAVCLVAALGLIISLLVTMKRRATANEAAIEQNSSDSALELLEVQPSGKNRMASADWYRGLQGKEFKLGENV